MNNINNMENLIFVVGVVCILGSFAMSMVLLAVINKLDNKVDSLQCYVEELEDEIDNLKN